MIQDATDDGIRGETDPCGGSDRLSLDLIFTLRKMRFFLVDMYVLVKLSLGLVYVMFVIALCGELLITRVRNSDSTKQVIYVGFLITNQTTERV